MDPWSGLWLHTAFIFSANEHLTPHISSELPYSVIIQAIGAAVAPLGKGLDFWASRPALGRDAVAEVGLGGSPGCWPAGLAACSCVSAAILRPGTKVSDFNLWERFLHCRVVTVLFSFLFSFLLVATNGPPLEISRCVAGCVGTQAGAQ